MTKIVLDRMRRKSSSVQMETVKHCMELKPGA